MWLAIAMIMAAAALLSPDRAEAAFWESFEGPLTSWKIADADVRHGVTRHERVDGPVHSGAWSEAISIQAGGGSFIHAAHNLPPVALIDELEVGLWVRADRPGMQLIARVVLPRSIDPATQRPVTLLVHGPLYSTTGRWQRLRLTELPLMVARQIRIERSENVHRTAENQLPYDIRGAYLDQVRVNVYGGQGATTVWLDDLEVTGFVDAHRGVAATTKSATPARQIAPPARLDGNRSLDKIARPVPTVPESHGDRTIAPVDWQSSILAAEGKPLLPRIIQHQGEPLAQLRSLGFNAVWLETPPSLTLMQEAVTTGVWLVCPAPSLDTPSLDFSLEPVLSWHVGRMLSRRDLRVTADRVTHIRRIDSESRRPICAQVASNLDAFSRHVDVLLLNRQIASSTLSQQRYFEWLTANTQFARPGSTFWATLHDRAPEAYAEQAAALKLPPPSSSTEWSTLRTMALGAIAHGAHGLVFTSPSRLDARDEPTRQRAAKLELLNLELSLIEPWAAAGRFVTTVDSNDPEVKAFVMQSDHTRLVLPIRMKSDGLPTAANNPVSDRSLSFVVPGVPESNRVYQLSLGGMRPLDGVRVAGGKSVTIAPEAVHSLLVLTSDPRVTGQLSGRLAKIRKRAAELMYAVASQSNRETDVTLRESRRVPANVVQPLMAKAVTKLQASRDLLARGDHDGSVRAAHASMTAVHSAQSNAQSHFGLAVSQGVTFSLPLEQRFDTLPHQALLSQQAADAPWNVSQLAGGDCEDLSQMVQAGWRHVEFPQDGVTTTVELSTHYPHGGRTSLHLRAVPAAGKHVPRLVESPPVWIETAGVPVNAGEIVRIQGAVRVTQPIQGSVDELLVFDSLGGKDLALRMGPASASPSQLGHSTGGWQQFVMYRAVPKSGEVSVTFALSGIGEAWVDNVTIQRATSLPLHPPPGPAPITGAWEHIMAAPAAADQPPVGPRFPTPPARGSVLPAQLPESGDPFSGLRFP